MLTALKGPQYEFTQDWFSGHEPHWQHLLGRVKPSRILEIGCYEGRASVFFIEAMAARGGSLTCVDTWEGGADLPAEAMLGVEDRFDANVAVAADLSGFARAGGSIQKLKQSSLSALAWLIAANGTPFDLIYVDASHRAPDVLTDAVLAFELLRFGGAMVFDDYAWQFEPQGRQDPLNMPKPAIDAFVNINMRRLTSMPFGGEHWQYLVLKACE